MSFGISNGCDNFLDDVVVLKVKRGQEVRAVTVVAGKLPVGIAELRKNNEQIVKAHEGSH
jgi:hypothetical protein